MNAGWEHSHRKPPAIISMNAANKMAYSLVTGWQSIYRCVFSRCSLVLTVVLDLWLHDVSAQAAHPVASEQDEEQHQVNTDGSK